ncbi:MAG: hypothetical protein HY812_17170 [Planctomycetes bacterium]|nr:hypothetical protein [Planctomycetota bacterium]
MQDASVALWVFPLTLSSGNYLIMTCAPKGGVFDSKWPAAAVVFGWAGFAVYASVVLTRGWDGWMARKSLRANVIVTVLVVLLAAVLFVPLPDSWLK